MDYFQQFKGRFIGIMQLDDCDTLLQKLVNNPDDQFFYDTLKSIPSKALDTSEFVDSIKQIKSTAEI